MGCVDAAVWEQKSDKGIYYTVSMHKNYKDKEDVWCTTHTLSVSDLPTASLALSKCFSWVKISKEEEAE